MPGLTSTLSGGCAFGSHKAKVSFSPRLKLGGMSCNARTATVPSRWKWMPRRLSRECWLPLSFPRTALIRGEKQDRFSSDVQKGYFSPKLEPSLRSRIGVVLDTKLRAKG